jgi:hypothetical protein
METHHPPEGDRVFVRLPLADYDRAIGLIDEAQAVASTTDSASAVTEQHIREWWENRKQSSHENDQPRWVPGLAHPRRPSCVDEADRRRFGFVGEKERGVDEREMRVGLGKVAKLPPLYRVVLLGE